MTTLQRELMIRQAAINYAHVAHHPNGSTDPLFDRSNAIMLLGIAASSLRMVCAGQVPFEVRANSSMNNWRAPFDSRDSAENRGTTIVSLNNSWLSM